MQRIEKIEKIGRYYQGKFKPKNPQKYVGDVNNICFRSSWEARVFKLFDEEPNIISWGSEELIVKYISPVDNRIHRYFPDIIAKVATKNGVIVYMIEIKPFSQTQPPKTPKRKTKNFLNEVATYNVNMAKWKAAELYCKERDWKFLVLTEKNIFSGMK